MAVKNEEKESEDRTKQLEKMIAAQNRAMDRLREQLEELKSGPTVAGFTQLALAGSYAPKAPVDPKTYYARPDKYVICFPWLAPQKALDQLGRIVEVPAHPDYQQEFDCLFGRKSGSYFTTTDPDKQAFLDQIIAAGDPYLSQVDSPASLNPDEKIALAELKAEEVAELKKYLAKRK